MPVTAAKGSTFSVLLSEDLRRQLFQAAERHERSSGAELRIALRAYLKSLGVGKEPAARG